MTSKTIRVGAIGFAAMLVLTLGGGVVFAASPTVDTEATETSSQSAVTDGHEVTDFNASGGNISTLQVDYDSDNPGIKIVDPDSGEVIKYVTNKSNPSYFVETNASADYYNTTFSESDFAAVPMAASENKSVTLRLVNNTTHSAPDTTNITIYLNNTDERAVIYAGQAAEDGDAPTTTLDVENTTTWWGFGSERREATVEHDNLGVNGSATDVYVLYADDNASKAFDAADEHGLLGSNSDGDYIDYYQLRVDDDPQPVFLNAAPDNVLDDATYGHTTTVDGHSAIKTELGSDYEDASTLDIESHANDDYGWWTSQQVKGSATESNFFSLSMGSADAGLVA